MSISDKIGDVTIISTKDKAKIINIEKINLYFEDNPIEAKLLQEQCPNCKVVLVDTSWYQVNKSGELITGIKLNH